MGPLNRNIKYLRYVLVNLKYILYNKMAKITVNVKSVLHDEN